MFRFSCYLSKCTLQTDQIFGTAERIKESLNDSLWGFERLFCHANWYSSVMATRTITLGSSQNAGDENWGGGKKKESWWEKTRQLACWTLTDGFRSYYSPYIHCITHRLYIPYIEKDMNRPICCISVYVVYSVGIACCRVDHIHPCSAHEDKQAFRL